MYPRADYKKSQFKQDVDDSIQYLLSFKGTTSLRNKSRPEVIQELESLLERNAQQAEHKYYSTAQRRLYWIYLPTWIGFTIFLSPLFAGVPLGYDTQFFLKVGFCILFGYSIVLDFSLDPPDPTEMKQKRTAPLALRILAIEEGRHKDNATPIHTWLTEQERKEICDTVNKAIVRLQLG